MAPTPEERFQIVKRLEKLIPLMSEYHPPGWVDFRTPTPPDWRGGVFILMPPFPRVEPLDGEIPLPQAAIDSSSQYKEDYLDFKCPVGSRAIATLIANDFFRATGGQAIVELHPHYWLVRMKIHIDDICW